MITYQLKTLDDLTYTFRHKKELLNFINENRTNILGFYKLKNDRLIGFATTSDIKNHLEKYSV
jgi:hypothetical protein